MNWPFTRRRTPSRSHDKFSSATLPGSPEDRDLDRSIEVLHVALLAQQELPIDAILEMETTMFGRNMQDLIRRGYKPSLEMGEADERWTVFGKLD